MKNIVKQFDKTGLVVLVLTFVAVLGFKAAEPMQTEQWYNVTIATNGDADTASDQLIGTAVSAPTGECSILKDEFICAIQLRLGPGVSAPSTVQEVYNMIANDEDIEILERAQLYYED